MNEKLDEVLRRTIIFRRLSADDRQRLAGVSHVRDFDKGGTLFQEGDASDHLYTVVTGRVKVFKTTARGTMCAPADAIHARALARSMLPRALRG